jgi:hypothetical protein
MPKQTAAPTKCWCGHPKDRHWSGASHMTFPDGCEDCPGWDGAHAYGQEPAWAADADGTPS